MFSSRVKLVLFKFSRDLELCSHYSIFQIPEFLFILIRLSREKNNEIAVKMRNVEMKR